MKKSFSRRLFQINLLILGLSLFCNSSLSEIFKWVDDEGNVHFTDRPPENKKTEKVTVKINTYTNVTISENTLNSISTKSKSTKKKKVIMYSTTWCGVCKRAKKYFQRNNIRFTEYDVEKSSKGKRDYEKMNGRGVPIILVGETRINGFDSARFNQIYGLTSQ